MVCMLHQPLKAVSTLDRGSGTTANTSHRPFSNYTQTVLCIIVSTLMMLWYSIILESQFLTSSIFWFSDRKRVEPIANLQVWMLTKQHPLDLWLLIFTLRLFVIRKLSPALRYQKLMAWGGLQSVTADRLLLLSVMGDWAVSCCEASCGRIMASPPLLLTPDVTSATKTEEYLL